MSHSELHSHPATFHGSQSESLLFSSWKLHPGESTFFAGLALVVVAIFFQAVKLIRAKLGRQCANITCKRYILNRAHIAQTLLFMLQFVLGYFLMLAVMTYNFWVVIAVVVGLGLAYFFMGWAEFEKLPRFIILQPKCMSTHKEWDQGAAGDHGQAELQPLSGATTPGSTATASSRLACSCDESRM